MKFEERFVQITNKAAKPCYGFIVAKDKHRTSPLSHLPEASADDIWKEVIRSARSR